MKIQFGQQPYQPQTGQSTRFGGKFFDDLRQQLQGEPSADTVEVAGENQTEKAAKTKGDGVRSKGSVMKGLTRTLHKTFLRPRGWLELASLLVIPVPIFQIKHFVEGFMGYNSLFIKRRLRGPLELTLGNSKALHNKPLIEAFKKD